MLSEVFSFWISVISRWFSWLFTLKINENPEITIGGFLLACAFIGVVLYTLLGTDFFPGHLAVSVDNSVNRENSNKRGGK